MTEYFTCYITSIKEVKVKSIQHYKSHNNIKTSGNIQHLKYILNDAKHSHTTELRNNVISFMFGDSLLGKLILRTFFCPFM